MPLIEEIREKIEAENNSSFPNMQLTKASFVVSRCKKPEKSLARLK